jgi:hypothetical protein
MNKLVFKVFIKWLYIIGDLETEMAQFVFKCMFGLWKLVDKMHGHQKWSVGLMKRLGH